MPLPPRRYEQAGADVKESLSGWAKQQEAALAEDQDSAERVLDSVSVHDKQALTHSSPMRLEVAWLPV